MWVYLVGNEDIHLFAVCAALCGQKGSVDRDGLPWHYLAFSGGEGRGEGGGEGGRRRRGVEGGVLRGCVEGGCRNVCVYV